MKADCPNTALLLSFRCLLQALGLRFICHFTLAIHFWLPKYLSVTFVKLKRASAILFLLIFGLQALGFKTHFCYHTNGTRFHGDCAEQLEKAEASGKSKASFHELKYRCIDIKLDKQYQQDSAFNNFNDQLFVLTSVPELPFITSLDIRQAIPVFSCRGGPPIFTQSLRGPPLV